VRSPTAERPALTLVVPVRDEAANVAWLAAAVAAEAPRLGAFELVFVDDGSTDATAEAVGAAARLHLFVRLAVHSVPAGQSAAVHSGVLLARAPLICTLDGDGQNPPAEIPRLLARLEAGDLPPGVGLIAGQRVGRRDGAWKRLGSALANGLRSRLLRDGTRDTGCGLKLFRRDAFLALPYFDHMHRFLPALFARDGWRTVHVDVAHAPRRAGRSKYGNLSRAAAGLHDLVGVSWLIRRRKKARAMEREVRR
jgi:dolichol-phosphate mannosyltransferase